LVSIGSSALDRHAFVGVNIHHPLTAKPASVMPLRPAQKIHAIRSAIFAAACFAVRFNETLEGKLRLRDVIQIRTAMIAALLKREERLWLVRAEQSARVFAIPATTR
jgi:hypothetical protein